MLHNLLYFRQTSNRPTTTTTVHARHLRGQSYQSASALGHSAKPLLQLKAAEEASLLWALASYPPAALDVQLQNPDGTHEIAAFFDMNAYTFTPFHISQSPFCSGDLTSHALIEHRPA